MQQSSVIHAYETPVHYNSPHDCHFLRSPKCIFPEWSPDRHCPSPDERGEIPWGHSVYWNISHGLSPGTSWIGYIAWYWFCSLSTSTLIQRLLGIAQQTSLTAMFNQRQSALSSMGGGGFGNPLKPKAKPPK